MAVDLKKHNVWMYWPGDYAEEFSENLSKGVMACCLPDDDQTNEIREIGDWAEYSKRNGLDEALKNVYDGREIGQAKKLVIEFLTQVKTEDYIIARKGCDSIIAVGVVKSGYFFDDTRSKYKHCRKVEWRPFKIEKNFRIYFKDSGWHRVTKITKQNDPDNNAEILLNFKFK